LCRETVDGILRLREVIADLCKLRMDEAGFSQELSMPLAIPGYDVTLNINMQVIP
jgi:hypothetical protein